VGARRSLCVPALALLLAGVAGCSSGSDGDAAASSTTTTTAAATTAPLPEGCDPDACPLQVAGARSDLIIGTALKFGAEREALEVREFSGVTSEREFLWADVHPEPDRYDFTGTDRVVAFAEEHDKDLTVTHFLWDPPALPSVLPDWVREVTDPDELRAVLRAHLTALHDRYAGKIDRWNVVNEPLAAGGTLEPDNHFFEVLGPGWVAEAFRMATEIWPEAQLVLNENLTEYLAGRSEGLVALVEQLLAEGVRVDRVGLQSHLFLGEPDFDLARRTMEQLTALGVPVDVTELDVPLIGVGGGNRIDVETQAERGRQMVETCLAVPRCESITFWGFDDGSTWLTDFIGPGTDPLPWDADLRPKPLHRAVLEALLAGRP